MKAVLNFATVEGEYDVEDALAAYTALRLPTKESVALTPIGCKDYHAMLEKADEPMRAMLLLVLNAAMYPSEVGAVKWEHLDLDKGVLVTERRVSAA